jgi:hypothetical protein
MRTFLSSNPDVVKWLGRVCYVDRTAFHPGDSAVRDFREGRRSVFYDIKNIVKAPEMDAEIELGNTHIV